MTEKSEKNVSGGTYKTYESMATGLFQSLPATAWRTAQRAYKRSAFNRLLGLRSTGSASALLARLPLRNLV